MPLSNGQRVDLANASLDSLLTIQSEQLAAWQAAGMPPSFSVDGESYSWGAWLKSIDDAIAAKVEQKGKLSGPFIVRSRGRA